MEHIIKKPILVMVALLFATLVGSASVMAQMCPEGCSVQTKSGRISIGILPDANDNWPIVVNQRGTYSCDDTSQGPNPANYPCLAWPYQCLSGPCEKVTKAQILIPKCCDKSIDILWTSKGKPNIDYYTGSQSVYPTVSNGYQLRMENISGSNPPPGGMMWFTTPRDIQIGTNTTINVNFPIGSVNTPCSPAGIIGPSCDRIPPVRIESRTQCWQFTAETDKCHRATTWYAEWLETNPCAVSVWAARSAVDEDPVPCDTVKKPDYGWHEITGESLGDIAIALADGTYQPLTEALVNNAKCSEGWLRFTDPATECNLQCFTSGGRRYCY